jgi:hypothetical protein
MQQSDFAEAIGEIGDNRLLQVMKEDGYRHSDVCASRSKVPFDNSVLFQLHRLLFSWNEDLRRGAAHALRGICDPAGVKCVSRNWHKRDAVRGAGRMSFTPHSSASHHSSAVLEEVTSITGTRIPLHLTRSTRSLQLPSGIASSVTTTVFSRPALSKPTAASTLLAHCITSPCASMPRAMAAAGLLVDTKITVPAGL